MTLIANPANHVKEVERKIDRLPPDQQAEFLDLLDELQETERRIQCRSAFMPFVKAMWPTFIEGKHHKIMAEKFDRIADGSLRRLIINMPPRHTKSEFASHLFPAYFLGRYPEKKIIQTSHTADLATGFGRKVRNLVATNKYNTIFPDTSLSADAKAAGRWTTDNGGEYFAIGVGGKLAGYGADLLIIDDPHSEQDYIQAIRGDAAVFDKTYEWYTSGPRQRLQPGAAIVIVMCMTGDTPVLMADGTEKPLQDIRPGDQVATYDKGRITTSRVVNWQSSGYDSVYTVQTQSGKMVRANKRHPFLVERNGATEWVRLQNLKPGDSLVSLKDVIDRQEPKQGRASVRPAKRGMRTTASTLMHRAIPSVITANGRARNANVASRFIAKGFAQAVIRRSIRRESKRREKIAPGASSTVTASRWNSTRQWWQNVTTVAISAAKSLMPATPALTGAASCASTIATTPTRSGGCFATTATLRSDTGKHRKSCTKLHDTYSVTTDRIESITPDGVEEVFDIEVERTHNFIANHVVVSNTRWHMRDVTGRIVNRMTTEKGVDDWEIIEFPALMPETDHPLWPEFWPKKELVAIREELPPAQWNAQYLQHPTAEEGALIKREWWNLWEKPEPPPCEYIIQAWDTAYKKTERADYCACTTWGVFYQDDSEGRRTANIILLNAINRRMEFPELKVVAAKEYQDWQPDALIIEAKASGLPLIQELRRTGVPVAEYTPHRGSGDKLVRVNSIADIFSSGFVWCSNHRWAQEVMEQFAAFPLGENDDLVDSGTIAMMRFRQGGFIRLESDEDEPEYYSERAEYY